MLCVRSRTNNGALCVAEEACARAVHLWEYPAHWQIRLDLEHPT